MEKFIVVGGFLVVVLLLALPASSLAKKDKGITKEDVAKRMAWLSIPFIKNEGQIPTTEEGREGVRFYAKTFGGAVFITKDGEIVYSLLKRTGDGQSEDEGEGEGIALKETLIGNKKPHAGQCFDRDRALSPEGEGESITRVSYFKGNDPSKWQTNISTYDMVSLGEVYDGIELKLKAYGNNVEKFFYVQPGAESKDIRLQIEGGKGLKINENGELEVETELGTVKFTKPIAYQEIEGKRVDVEVAYDLEVVSDQALTPELTYAFNLGDYDKTKTLIIDPLLASTFIGGSGGDWSNWSNSITFDSSGNIYVTGVTWSSDYPITPGAYDTSFNGNGDVFVSKLNSTLTTLLASTFIGGSSYDYGNSIVLDSSDNVYVTGETSSSDYPTTPGAYDTSLNGNSLCLKA